MRRLLFLLFCCLGPVGTAAQETVISGISKDNIALTANFEGSEIFVFGAIRRSWALPTEPGPLDIIVTIKGPPASETIQKKSRHLGIWINDEQVSIREAPSLYAVATTRPLEGLLSATERLRYGIGMDQAVRKVGAHSELADTAPFAEALVRLRGENGLYQVDDGAVQLAEDILFQASFALPANLVEGTYLTEFFLVRNRKVVSSGSTDITVQKAGLERWLYNMSQNLPLLYGIMSVAIALFAGWLAALAFGANRR